MHFTILALVKKFCRSRDRALDLATVHEQPFPLPHCCGIGDLPICYLTCPKYVFLLVLRSPTGAIIVVVA
jgi:hypothetical protein